MYDNNEGNVNIERNDESTQDEKKATSVLLKDMVTELEEQLYSTKIQLRTQTDLLQEKELELKERERTKIHNLDLFSPIYNKAYDIKELVSMMDLIRQKVEELNQKQQQLINRINGIKTAINCIEISYQEKETTEIEQSHNIRRFNEKGLGILEAQEIERQRIARDLHDTTVQNLTSLVHKTELCIKLIDMDAIRAKLELNTMSNTIKTIINDMRGIIYNLKPMSLDDLGLTITVERYANRLMDTSNIEVYVHTNEEVKEILPVIKLTLFRIIQEACYNVIKHANASLIEIDINYQEKNILVSVRDDGNGFHINKEQMNVPEHSSSFGLSIMKERISLLSGKLNIQSEKGSGTIVTVSAPLTIYEGEKNA